MPFDEVELGKIALAGDAGLVDGPFGSNLPASEYVPRGVPVIRGSNLSKGEVRFRGDEFVFVSEATADKLARSTCIARDIIFTKKGTLGQVGIVPSRPYEKYLLSSNQMRLRVDEAVANPDFVYYALSIEDSISKILREAEHTGVPKINLAYIRRFRIPLPPRSVQDQTCELVSAFDDRIELLRQTNATLESIAQALFKSWFIDFDPVHAKAEGREPAGMDADTEALFPSEFEESALGLIPKGWMVNTIADLCARVSNGGTPSRSKPDFWVGGTVPWFKTGELFDAQLLRPTEFVTSKAVSDTSVKVLPRHSVLMAIYAAPTVGRLGVLTEEAAFNQACTGMVAKAEIGPWFLFQTLFHGRKWFNSRANGAAQQNISKGIVESYRCVRPKLELLQAFNEVVGALYASAERNARLAQSLAQLRETLLPPLIFGKLRLPEAQKQLQEALA